MILFICLLLFFFIGMPVAFALGIGTMIPILLEGKFALSLIPQRMFTGLDSFPIMAIPLFMLAGSLMDQGGMSKRIVEFSSAIFGFIKGSFAYITVFASMIFAGVSGSSTADTAAIGSLLMPAMREKGYDMRFATVLQAAAGAIGPVIPPSILMVLIGYSTNTSVGALFLGGLIPGVLIGLALMVTSYFHIKKGGDAYLAATKFEPKKVWSTFITALPGLGLPIIIIFGIVLGVFTATEAAVIAVFYGLLVGIFIYKEIKIKELPKLLLDSAKMASMVMIITSTAYIFAWYITAKQLPVHLTEVMNAYVHSQAGFLVFLNIVLLLVGMFMESFSAIIILMPILFPVAVSYGIDPIHFGVIVCVNLAIGYVTPPYGATLFVSCGLTGKSIREVLPFVFPIVASMVVVLIIITYFPQTFMWIPRMMAN